MLLHGNTVLGNCLCFPNGVKFQIQMRILVMPTVLQAPTESPAPVNCATHKIVQIAVLSISSCMKCWDLGVFVMQGCCQERERVRWVGSAGQLPLHDWLHSSVTHWRQGEVSRGISPLWAQGNKVGISPPWFRFVLFPNECLAVNWIKSTLCFTSSIPECARTRQMRGKWEYRGLFLTEVVDQQ